ncbi:MAG: ribonuclease HI family protein [Dehalococcoidales bacterium]|nr:ribonuclease HI family protein [Dehalococcoidales bacterium]MDD3264726.1 ribonuclease HI family protein [Dehalococcoidales bacterium]MDD4322554.1 ribonuclease HI family protein [Dehalococcoidales bacterium]MDD4794318.1 ribonuclease HI family protein [Dehalococcoidales bacterium]MDD5121880.1 ribonuclease HI family protein [Dehalococcoidales bacterium]
MNKPKMPAKVIINSDGASRGNPGRAAIGAVITDEHGNVLQSVSRFIGITTNNQAEYKALIAGLEAAVALGASDVTVRIDSELVVKQIKGQYRVKKPELAPLHRRACELLAGFKSHSLEHVFRNLNQEADRLANLALD